MGGWGGSFFGASSSPHSQPWIGERGTGCATVTPCGQREVMLPGFLQRPFRREGCKGLGASQKSFPAPPPALQAKRGAALGRIPEQGFLALSWHLPANSGSLTVTCQQGAEYWGEGGAKAALGGALLPFLKAVFLLHGRFWGGWSEGGCLPWQRQE